MPVAACEQYLLQGKARQLASSFLLSVRWITGIQCQSLRQRGCHIVDTIHPQLQVAWVVEVFRLERGWCGLQAWSSGFWQSVGLRHLPVGCRRLVSQYNSVRGVTGACCVVFNAVIQLMFVMVRLILLLLLLRRLFKTYNLITWHSYDVLSNIN